MKNNIRDSHFFETFGSNLDDCRFPKRIWAQSFVERFHFKKPAITSRDTLFSKPSYFIVLSDENHFTGIGEASPIFGLSRELQRNHTVSKFCKMLSMTIKTVNQIANSEHTNKGLFLYFYKLLDDYPSLYFALETALLELLYKNNMDGNSNEKKLSSKSRNDSQGEASTKTPKTKSHEKNKSVPINGLVWMGSIGDGKKQVEKLIKNNFRCIKMKISKNSFKNDLELIAWTRRQDKKLVIRLDANGAFSNHADALRALEQLSKYSIDSIEQPLKPCVLQNDEINNHDLHELMKLTSKSPIPIALDEELIGLNRLEDKLKVLETSSIDAIVLKPTLLGGFQKTYQWIELAKKTNKRYWLTSSLESNIGLESIFAWIVNRTNVEYDTYQGLGTGALFWHNFPQNLKIENGNISLVSQ